MRIKSEARFKAGLKAKGSGRFATEFDEHIAFADWLTTKHIYFLHVPNEGQRHFLVGKKLKQMGMRKGAADILIFDPPPSRPGSRGTAIELKCRDGRVTEDQRWFLVKLARRGWYTAVCYGAEEAIKVCAELGY